MAPRQGQCSERESGEKRTLIWNRPEDGDIAQIDFIADNALGAGVKPSGVLSSMDFTAPVQGIRGALK